MPRTPPRLRANTAPAAVAETVARLGANIATARINRRWRREDLAAKAAVSVGVIDRIEHGHLGTGIGSWVAALWALGLHHDVAKLASPSHDAEGQTLAASRLGKRVRPDRKPDDDF
jgi:transcriptional regulator with XRE-family HTH domain